VLFPIPTPPPGPSTAIKAPYKGFYKDLASISNYIGTSLDDHSLSSFVLCAPQLAVLRYWCGSGGRVPSVNLVGR
jgi:hypothetical protein